MFFPIFVKLRSYLSVERRLALELLKNYQSNKEESYWMVEFLDDCDTHDQKAN